MRRLAPLLLLLAACGDDEPAQKTGAGPGGEAARPEVAAEGRQAPDPKADGDGDREEGRAEAEDGEPRYVVYDYILIPFEGSYKKVESFRSRAEAERLAEKVFERVQEGEDWDELKERYSEDLSKDGKPLGPYTLLNFGLDSTRPHEIFERENWAPRIAHAVFTMDVGDAALIRYHDDEPGLVGYQIVKRLQ